MSAPRESAPSGRRLDIQGLRALAVIAVIANHLVGWPMGGFAGVDVFFVISGFLITGLLLTEHENTGRISIAGFYGRRIRRIAPAALIVLAVTVGAGFLLFNGARALATAWDAAWSFLFVANWHFAAVGTDYFTTTDAVSPLQHYWSLSVEEQFYLVWPLLMLVVMAASAKAFRRPAAARVAAAVIAAAIVAVSFSWSLTDTAAHPTVAYFSTLSRGWELAVGAVLAAAVPLLVRIPAALRAILGWTGLVALIWVLVALDDSRPFPGPWADLPVAATALILLAGVGGPQRHLIPLTNRVSVYLGTISYSLYLWHFPAIVFLALLVPTATPLTKGLVAVGILVLSMASHAVIERPFQVSPLFRTFRREPGARREAWSEWRDTFGTRFIVAVIGLLAVTLVSALAVGGVQQPGISAAQPVAGPKADPEVALQAELSAAASATAWPGNLSPSLDDAISQTTTTNPALGCFTIGATPDIGSCTWGDSNAPRHMYLVGDSTALAYAPAFKAIAEASGGQWKITTVGLYGCRFTDVDVANDGAGVMDACPQRKSDIATDIARDQPQLVVVSNAYALGQTPSGSPLSTADLVAATSREMQSYNVGDRIAYLAPPPLGEDLAQCYSRVSSPQDCNAPVDSAWLDFAHATKAAEGSHYLTSLPFSCAGDVCPAFAGTVPTKFDTVHITDAYAVHIAPVIQHDLEAAGLM